MINFNASNHLVLLRGLDGGAVGDGTHCYYKLVTIVNYHLEYC